MPRLLPRLAISLAAAVLGLIGLTACDPTRITYTYEVRTIGPVVSNVAEFSNWAGNVYVNPNGWGLNGKIKFQRVVSGGNFTLWLATANQVPTFSPGCSAVYSCRVGRNVIINEDRWRFGSPSFRGVPLATYRDMVINHETGHWLGLGHAFCPASGAAAPVMQQQSISLQGCRANAWPLASEKNTVARARGI